MIDSAFPDSKRVFVPYSHPVIAVTMGDPAGVGPEVAVRAVLNDRIRAICRPVLVGCPAVLDRAARMLHAVPPMRLFEALSRASLEDAGDDELLVFNACRDDAADVPPGVVDARGGRAAWDCLIAATDAALAGDVDALVTAPLNKAALHAAGLRYPGHTEILAARCGVERFAMMLYLPADPALPTRGSDLAVAHVTLHTSIRSVPDLLTMPKIVETIQLVDEFLERVSTGSRRSIAVCALNPHAGEDGLFGDEEARIIAPAVRAAAERGVDVYGPLPADTLFRRALAGEFDGVVAMYHDQGHIAIKLADGGRAVNVTLGLPIVRTSPSHGTAFDIAWQGSADPAGMIAAIQTAAKKRMKDEG